jgi:hypothetical protein
MALTFCPRKTHQTAAKPSTSGNTYDIIFFTIFLLYFYQIHSANVQKINLNYGKKKPLPAQCAGRGFCLGFEVFFLE